MAETAQGFESIELKALGSNFEMGENELIQNRYPVDILFIAKIGTQILQGCGITPINGQPMERHFEETRRGFDKATHKVVFRDSGKDYVTAVEEYGFNVFSNGDFTAQVANGLRNYSSPMPAAMLDLPFDYSSPPDPTLAKEDGTPRLASLVDTRAGAKTQASLARILESGEVANFGSDFDDIPDGIGYFLPAYAKSVDVYEGQPIPARIGKNHNAAIKRVRDLIGSKASLLAYTINLEPPAPWLHKPKIS